MRHTLINSTLLGLSLILTVTCHAAERADLAILNANVLTMDASRPLAEAVVLRGGRIVYVGDTKGAQAWAADKLVDAAGATVMPGLIDTHIHPVIGAVQMDDCSLDDRRLTLEQIAEVVSGCMGGTADLPQGQILSVINLNPANFTASKSDLDKITALPLALFATDEHTAWANSAALALAGIGKNTAAPANGQLVRNSAGEPTGQLIDNATQLLKPYLPRDDFQTSVEMTARALQLMHAAGLTSLMEASATEEELKIYRELADTGRLTMHTSVALRTETSNSEENLRQLLALRERYSGASNLRIDTAKIFVDGVLESPTQSAALLQPYLDAKGKPTAHTGNLYAGGRELNGLVMALARENFNVHLHAIGDRAVRAGLDAFATARKQQSAARFSISHLELIHPDDLPRFAALDVYASFQLAWGQPDHYSVEAVQPYLGDVRSRWIYPAKSLLDAGASIAGGSDWNVSSFNPFEAMAVAICRCNFEEPERGLLLPEQALGTQDMLRAYTINAAAMLGLEGETGSLTPGKRADLILLDRDVSRADAASLRDTKVLATLAAGRLVHGRM